MNDNMETVFASSAGLRILSHFLENGGQARYVKELSRGLGISAGTASQLCRQLLKEHLLKAKRTGNLLQYSANDENVLVRRLKTDLFLHKLLLHEADWSGEEVQAIALYGSYASGEYSEKSDVDILVLTNIDKRKAEGMFRRLRGSLKKELSVTVMPLSKWRELARKKDRFYIEVLANHILLAGKSLVMD